MRKYLLITVALSLGLVNANARADVTMKLPDNIKQTFQQMESLLDQCIGSTVSHSDTTSCQQVHSLLFQLANQPTTPAESTTPSPSASPEPTPSPASAAPASKSVGSPPDKK